MPDVESDAPWCNACLYGECEGCWSENDSEWPWPGWAGEPFECACPHRGTSVTPPGESPTSPGDPL